MKWIYKEKKESEWKKWFAWFPVPIGQETCSSDRFPFKDGTIVVWFEWVERKWLDWRGSNSYEYRKA